MAEKLTAEQIEYIRELEARNARLMEAFEQACVACEELASTAIDSLELQGEVLNGVDREELETMRRNRKELLG